LVLIVITTNKYWHRVVRVYS